MLLRSSKKSRVATQPMVFCYSSLSGLTHRLELERGYL